MHIRKLLDRCVNYVTDRRALLVFGVGLDVHFPSHWIQRDTIGLNIIRARIDDSGYGLSVPIQNHQQVVAMLGVGIPYTNPGPLQWVAFLGNDRHCHRKG